MTGTQVAQACQQVLDHMPEVLDGSAPEALYTHLGDCESCRDARHDAARAVSLARAAGADYVAPADIEDRVLDALDERPEQPTKPVTGDTEPAPAAEPPKPATGFAQLKSRLKDVRVAYGLGAAALAAGIALAVSGGDAGLDSVLQGGGWKGQLSQIASTLGGNEGVELCKTATSCRPASVGDAVAAGTTVKTRPGTRARIALKDGSELTIDGSTELELLDGGRRARLVEGSLVADVAHHATSKARIDVPQGRVEVLGTKFAVHADSRSTSVEVTRGRVRLVDTSSREVLVGAGEAGRLERGSAPEVSATPSLGEAVAWAEMEREDEPQGTPGLGQLVAKKPGVDQELKDAVRLASHSVKVRISGAMARTEIDETFTNHTNDVLEGIYRFPIPPDAKIERLALEVDGKLIEGAFLDRERAAAIWRGAIVNSAPQARRPQEEIVWVPGPWKDPALLEWQRGNRFELKIFPIPKQGSRRVVLAYTQLVQPIAGVRRYVYPLAHDPGGSTRVAKFELDVQVRGNDPSFALRPQGYAVSQSTVDSAERLGFSSTGFVPSGDFSLEYALPGRDAPMAAWSYRSNDQGYAAVALRPSLPRVSEGERREFVLVVDSSRSMFGESYRRATRLATRIVRELDPLDRVSVLACDETCRELPGGAREPGLEASNEARRFLEGIEPEGASDVAGAVRSAAARRQGSDRSLRVVYIGDGTPTVGPVRPGSITRAVESAIPRDARVTAVAIGSDSDTETLGAVARGGRGVVLPYVPGETTAKAAYAVLGVTYGAALSDVSVELPEGLSDVAPARLDSIVAGSETLIVAKMARSEVNGSVVLRGKIGDRSFEQRYPLDLRLSDAPGNAFVPRMYASARIADLERRNDAGAKTEAIELSSKFNVASRYTSLLVLESEAMFRAFGLDNTRRAPTWTGEEDAEVELAKAEEKDAPAKAYDLGFPDEDQPSSGSGGGTRMSAGAAPKKKSAYDPFADDEFSGSSPPAAAAPAPPPMATAGPRPRAAEAEGVARANKPTSDLSRRGTFCAPSDPLCVLQQQERRERRPLPGRSWIPMRRTWERTATFDVDRLIPNAAGQSKMDAALREAELDPNRRQAVKKLYTLYALSGDLRAALDVVERWSSRDPLDADALTARADLAARAGDRDRALRMLGSVIDVRPGEVKAQKRLSRLYRWAGQPLRACRYSIAAAELNQKDAQLLTEAVRCARSGSESDLADELLAGAEPSVRNSVTSLLAKSATDDALSGDFRIEARWEAGGDLDLGLLDTDGNRISWLGAPTRAVISARDVTSDDRETLAVRGAPAGEYVIEVVRSSGDGSARGTLTITVGKSKRSVPFSFDGPRGTVALANVKLREVLVPVR